MVFINGFSFTEATLVKRSLESFFGIGPKVSQQIMAKFHIHPWAKVGALKNATVMDLTAELSTMKIENDARREVQDNIRRLKDMGTYRGRRHAMGLLTRSGRSPRTTAIPELDTMENDLSVIIVEAGVSGLLLAQQLRQLNIPFQIFERDSSFTVRGSGWGLTLHWSLPALRQLLPERLLSRLCETYVDRGAVERGEDSTFPFFDLTTGERKGGKN
ncbi:hypothetical protein E8E11_007539 [Didymella keratinophila]|nr:hypothetical protein E8E11_007539 [Didymella keratinophila]